MDKIVLPRELYKYNTAHAEISGEGKDMGYWIPESITWSPKIETNVKGLQFPLKGFTTPTALKDINIGKAIILSFINIFSIPIISIAVAVYVIFKKGTLTKILDILNRPLHMAVKDQVLKDIHVSDFVLNLQFFIFTFLVEMGCQEETADRFAESFAQLIEYDNAYRYRVVDAFSEINRPDFNADPRRELDRVVRVMINRDMNALKVKYKKIGRMLKMLMLFPSVKHALKKALNTSVGLDYDDSDKYYACLREDCNYMGMSNEDRKFYAKTMGWEYGEKLKDIV